MRILSWFKDWWSGLSSLGRRVIVVVICVGFLGMHLFILRLDFVALSLLALMFLILFPDIFSEMPTPGGVLRLRDAYEKTVAKATERDPRIIRRNRLAGLFMLLAEKADEVIRPKKPFGSLTAQLVYESRAWGQVFP